MIPRVSAGRQGNPTGRAPLQAQPPQSASLDALRSRGVIACER